MVYKACKFGGSSVANAEQIQKVAGIISSDKSRKYIVVSAPGKYDPGDTKVTDLLINICNEAISGKKPCYEKVVERYAEIIRGLSLGSQMIDHIAQRLEERVNFEYGTREEFIDSVKAFGEEQNALLIAEYLRRNSMNARYADPLELGIIVSEEFGNAQVLDKSYSAIKSKASCMQGILVIPGFYGYTEKKQIATFSRGGSDLTGAIIAAAVGADEYENWTDVDGILMADPRIVETPQKIRQITYEELRELSYMGFSVFHEEAMFPVIKAHIPTHLRNTNKPALEGTRILEYRLPQKGEIIAGIALKKGFCTIDMKKFLMNREVGFIRRTATIFEEEGLSIEHIPSGIDSISVILEKEQLGNGMLSRLVRRMHDELKIDELKVRDDHALVCAVGQGMIHTTGVASRITGACAKNGINIEMINQGASELSITLAVKEKDADDAVRAIYGEFVKHY